MMNLNSILSSLISRIRSIKLCLDECSPDISNELAISYIPVIIYIPVFIFGFNVLHDFVVEISTLTVVYFSGATINIYKYGKTSSVFGYSISFVCVSSVITAIEILHSENKLPIIANHTSNIVAYLFIFSVLWFAAIKIYLSVKLCLDNKKQALF